MTNQLTAKFESHDAAELAQSNLRRSGIAFSVVEITPAIRPGTIDLRSDSRGIPLPFCQMGTLPWSASFGDMVPHPRGRSVLGGSPAYAGETLLRINVDSKNLNRAKEVMLSSYGSHLSISSP